MQGTVAVTDFGWYARLRSLPGLEEVNFWKPSAQRPFVAPEFSPFFFKLKAPHEAICGFGYFARYSSLPDWLAWESFGLGNGVSSLAELRERIAAIRERIRFQGAARAEIDIKPPGRERERARGGDRAVARAGGAELRSTALGLGSLHRESSQDDDDRRRKTHGARHETERHGSSRCRVKTTACRPYSCPCGCVNVRTLDQRGLERLPAQWS